MSTEHQSRKTPKYRIVVDFIHDHIRANRLCAGAKLPTEQELCAMLSVSADTVQRAMRRLKEEGTVIRRQGSGCYVADSFYEKAPPSPEKVFHLVIDYENNPYSGSGKYAEGVRKYFSEKGWKVTVHVSNCELYSELRHIQRLKKEGETHILLCPVLSEWAFMEYSRLNDEGCRFTFLDRKMLGVSGDLVETDNAGGIRMLCEHLIGLGHRNILFLDQRPYFFSSTQGRLEGYKTALLAHHLPVREENIIISWDYMELLRTRLQSPDRPTAVVAVNDDTAVYAIRLAESLGLRVPDDLSVTGFDGVGLQNTDRHVLTTVVQPFFDVGYEAARLFCHRLTRPEERGFCTVTLPVTLSIGNTTKAPPALPEK